MTYFLACLNPRMNYLPWPTSLNELPIYPIIYNTSRTYFKWNIYTKKHDVFSYKASWKTFTNDFKIIERKHFQFCRNEVNSSNLPES